MEDFVWQCLLTVVTKFPAFFSGGKFFTKLNMVDDSKPQNPSHLFGKSTTMSRNISAGRCNMQSLQKNPRTITSSESGRIVWSSSSGITAYVEPAVAVPLNNKLAEARADVLAAEYSVLLKLTDQVPISLVLLFSCELLWRPSCSFDIEELTSFSGPVWHLFKLKVHP